MKKTVAFLTALVLVSLTAPTFAAESKTFTWARPDLRVNGDALPKEEINGYTIECGTAAGGPYDFVTFSASDTGAVSSAQSFTSIDIFTPGTYFCRLGALTTNPDGGAGLDPGEFSPDVSFSVVACTSATCGAIAPNSWSVT